MTPQSKFNLYLLPFDVLENLLPYLSFSDCYRLCTLCLEEDNFSLFADISKIIQPLWKRRCIFKKLYFSFVSAHDPLSLHDNLVGDLRDTYTLRRSSNLSVINWYIPIDWYRKPFRTVLFRYFRFCNGIYISCRHLHLLDASDVNYLIESYSFTLIEYPGNRSYFRLVRPSRLRHSGMDLRAFYILAYWLRFSHTRRYFVRRFIHRGFTFRSAVHADSAMRLKFPSLGAPAYLLDTSIPLDLFRPLFP